MTSVHCKLCKRQKNYSSDNTCKMGGYCEWITPSINKNNRMWLPLLLHPSSTGWMTFQTSPDRHFKPVGLMFWDLPDDAILESCKCMNQEVVIASHGKLPAKVFARAESYEALQKKLQDGEEIFSEWIDCEPMSPANRIYILLSSASGASFEKTKAAFWGYADP